MKSQMSRWMWTMAAAVALLAGSKRARAATDPASCQNDVDCVSDPTCGGNVCDYNKGMTCQPAGKAAKGADGWCSADSDCKCKGLGATCAGVYCTFTTPAQGSGGSGGSSSTTGSGGSSSTTGSGGSSSTTGSGGSGGSTGGSRPTGTPAPASDSGGCTLASTPTHQLTGASVLVGLAAVAFGIRRRRAA